jgi:hypothetical protein
MTERSPRSERLAVAVWLVLLAAVTTNTVAAFTTPDVAWWDPLRFALSTAFVLALLGLVASRLVDRRAG